MPQFKVCLLASRYGLNVCVLLPPKSVFEVIYLLQFKQNITHSCALHFRVLVNSRSSQVGNHDYPSQVHFVYWDQSSINKGMMFIPTQLLLLFLYCCKNSSHKPVRGLIPALGRQRMVGLCEFEVSLV